MRHLTRAEQRVIVEKICDVLGVEVDGLKSLTVRLDVNAAAEYDATYYVTESANLEDADKCDA